MVSDDPTAQQDDTRRGSRHFVIGASVFVLSLVVVAVYLAWSSIRLYSAILHLRSHGASVRRGSVRLGGKIWSVDLSAAAVDPDSLSDFQDDLRLFPELELIVENAAADDALLERLQGIHNLRVLLVGSPRVTDDGLECVGRFRNLQVLGVGSPNISDRGLLELKNLSQLRELYVVSTPVTRSGVERLRESLPNLYVEFSEGSTSDRTTEVR